MPAYSIGLVPYVETVHDRLTIEIRRGVRGAVASANRMLTRPARDVEPKQVVEAIEQGMRALGTMSFPAIASCSDYLSLLWDGNQKSPQRRKYFLRPANG